MDIIKTTTDHLVEIALTLSEGDRNEFEAMKPGRNVELVLLNSLGETSRTIVDEYGRVLACGGSKGCLWFVTSSHVDLLAVKHKIRFFKLLKQHLECVRKFTTREERTNFVHERNKEHINLLEHLGAEFAGYAYTVGTGERFRQFWL